MSDTAKQLEDELTYLSVLRRKLKSGEYSGADVMQAWLVIGAHIEALEKLHALEQQVAEAEPIGYIRKGETSLLSSGETHSVDIHSKTKAKWEGLARFLPVYLHPPVPIERVKPHVHELAENIRRNIRHVHKIAGLGEATDLLNHIDTIAQEIQSSQESGEGE